MIDLSCLSVGSWFSRRQTWKHQWRQTRDCPFLIHNLCAFAVCFLQVCDPEINWGPTIFLNTYLNYETQTLGLSIFAVLFFTLLQNVYLLWRGNLNLFAKLCSLMPVCWCNTFKNNYWLLIHTDWLPSLTELNVSGVFCAVCNWMGISEP